MQSGLALSIRVRRFCTVDGSSFCLAAFLLLHALSFLTSVVGLIADFLLVVVVVVEVEVDDDVVNSVIVVIVAVVVVSLVR